VSGSDGNLWFAAGTGAYAFSPTSHTIVGTTSSLSTGSSINQLLANPANGAILIQSQDSSGSGVISAFTPGSAPTLTQVYKSSTLAINSLATGGSNIYAISVSGTSGSSVLVLTQSNYTQSSIALPPSFEFQGTSMNGKYSGPLVVAANGDFFMASGCNSNYGCGGGVYDVAQVTSGGIVVGQGPQSNHLSVGESVSLGGGVIGSDGNIWFTYSDGMSLQGTIERVTPNAH
jgi:hypothetical protein